MTTALMSLASLWPLDIPSTVTHFICDIIVYSDKHILVGTASCPLIFLSSSLL